MKIPNSVRIGGIEYAIDYKENVRNGNQLCYGVICYDDSTITLSTSDGAGHQPSFPKALFKAVKELPIVGDIFK